MVEFRTIPPKLTKYEWNALLDHGLEKPYNFIIFKRTIDGTDYYYAQYGTGADQAGKIAFGGPDNAGNINGTNKSAVIQAAINALTSGGTIFLKDVQLPNDVTYGDNILIIEEYQGQHKTYSNLAKFIAHPILSSDPDTTGWGSAEAGRRWFNSTDKKEKFWDGTSIQTLPGGDMWKSVYDTNNNGVVDNSEKLNGLTVSEVRNHPPQAHKSSHISGGSDAFDATDVLEAAVKRIRETSGPTILTIGDVSDGQYLKRVGTSIVGAAAAAGTYKLAPSFTIFKVGSTYYAMDEDGNIVYSGTNASAVIQAAINALYGPDKEGDIFLKRAVYDITNDIAIGKRTRLIAEMGTVFNVVNNLNTACIIISDVDNEARWGIHGLKIEMNYYNGHGIYSAHSCQSGNLGHPTIRDIKISKINPGYCAIWLYDTFFLHMENVEIRRCKGTGMRFSVNESYQCYFGNSWFSNILIGLYDNDTVGFHIQGGTTYGALVLSQIDRLQVGGSSSCSNVIGLKIENNNYVQFDSLNIEIFSTGVLIDDSNDILITNPYIWGTTTPQESKYGIRLINNTYNVVVIGGRIGGGPGYGWKDESTSTSLCKNRPINTRIAQDNGVPHDAYGTMTDPTLGYWYRSPNQGYPTWSYYRGDVIWQTGDWAPPPVPASPGIKVTVHNTTQGGSRLYIYTDAWHYVPLS